ncbi:hypothetical protein UPYG_G00050970, partial [Umbra pygmaea]
LACSPIKIGTARFLATGDSYRTIASSYRVCVSTVCQIIPQVGTAVLWSGGTSLCAGMRVVVKAPHNSGSHNYKGTFSTILLAVVDAKYRFRVIDVGGNGRTSDAGILENSTFGEALQAGTLPLLPDLLCWVRDMLPGLDAANSSSREALRLRDVFMAHLDGAVPWQLTE